MLKHYVASALRAWRHAPWATVVNVLTLALGLVSFMIAFGVAHYLSSADRQFANADRTLVVTTRQRAREGSFDTGVRPRSNEWLAQYLKADFPHLAVVARVILPKKNAAEDIAAHAEDRVRLSARDVSGSIAAIDALWKRLAPNVAIKRRFAEDYFNDSYASFARINAAFSAFAVVAVAIATIGLAAIAIAVTNRRRAEIGVRKILGGSARQMTLVLLAAFGWPVAVANLIAWPLAYVAARAYLDAFIQPIELTALPFVGSLIATLLVAGLAVARQTLSAARLKPASVLRHE